MPVKRGLSSLQRTLGRLREQAACVDKAEKFIPFPKPHGHREDLFGFIDIIAIRHDCIVAVQACMGSSRKEHTRKILENEYALAWAKTGNPIELWSWRKLKAVRGGKRMYWEPHIDTITVSDWQKESEND